MEKRKYNYWLPDNEGKPIESTTYSNSVIFIGANGAGKSRLGAWIEQQNTSEVHRIGAQRNLNFDAHIPMKSYQESEELVLYDDATYNGRQNKIYKFGNPEDDRYVTHVFNDFNNVLSALIAKTGNEDRDYIERCKKAEKKGVEKPPVPVSDIDKLKKIWHDIFPQRELKYGDYSFYAVDPSLPDAEEYSATKMSDGERAALYFIAQVLCVPKNKILLVDEPELHLHKSLMNRLWTALEGYREDCLFIYITHDTQFASMHLSSEKYWVKSYVGKNKWDFQKLEQQDLPEDLLLDLLGNRKNVLFVEGEKGSYDSQIYPLLYRDYYVIPCGSCTQVIARTKAFNKTEMLHHYSVYGIIDRDYRSDYEIDTYKKDHIFTINVAEVENLFITEDIIKEVAKVLGRDADQCFQKVSDYVINERFKKQLNSQICEAVVAEIKYRLNAIDIDKKNDEKAKESLDVALNGIKYDDIKNDIEIKFSRVAESGDYAQVIRSFNKKELSKSVGHFLGLQNEEYCSTVLGMIKNGSINAEETLGQYMPSKEDIPR